MILAFAVFAAAVLYVIKTTERKVEEKIHTIKLSENDRKIQSRVTKEIQNFLNYNGDEQDDIL